MGIRTVDTYKVHCDHGRGRNACRVWTVVYGCSQDEAFEQLSTIWKWQVEVAPDWSNWTLRCPEHRTDVVHRPPDMSHEDYQALSDYEKSQRQKQYQAYMDQFSADDYPVREQRTPSLQRYADSQRAIGYNPPGVYC